MHLALLESFSTRDNRIITWNITFFPFSFLFCSLLIQIHVFRIIWNVTRLHSFCVLLAIRYTEAKKMQYFTHVLIIFDVNPHTMDIFTNLCVSGRFICLALNKILHNINTHNTPDNHLIIFSLSFFRAFWVSNRLHQMQVVISVCWMLSLHRPYYFD